jgi:uncharacterized membrane protein YgcG
VAVAAVVVAVAGRRNMRAFCAFVAMTIFVLFAPARANDMVEEIGDYRSDITVEPNGLLSVRETIVINALGFRFEHGILRDFPTTARGVHSSFDVTRVTRDGHDEPYDVATVDGGKEIKIGSADIDLSQGHHTYVIQYTTDRQIRFFPKYDEIYWNVTGNGWRFDIEHAQAIVHLPSGAQIVQTAAYTGKEGERGTNAQTQKINANTVSFETTTELNHKEGLTIAVGFSKGAVAPPTASDLRRYFVRDYLPAFVMLAGLAVLSLYFLIAWFLVGRDPPGGTIIPLFAPPKGLSAGATRYLVKGKSDSKAFAATLVSLAVKGFLKISRDADKTYVLTGTGGGEDLTPDESQTASSLFLYRPLKLTSDGSMWISLAIAALRKALTAAYGAYIKTNRAWFIPGVVILALTGLAVVLSTDTPLIVGIALVIVCAAGGGTSLLAYLCFQAWKGLLTTRTDRGSNFVMAFVLLLPICTLGGLVVGALAFSGIDVPFVLVLLMFPAGVTLLFQRLLEAPTEACAKLRAQIAGFRLYLTTAETDRMEKLNPPDVTPDVFEKYLSYAIALDCENQWAKKFEAQAGMSAAQASSYEPGWYTGGDFATLGVAGFASALGSTLSSAASAVSFSSSSGGGHSGSGGGGFSGGGGGGGGGGGW